MTVATSTVPAIYAALQEQLSSALGSSGVDGHEVLVGYGGSVTTAPWDHCVLGNVDEGVNDWAYLSGPRFKRNESYQVFVGFHAVRSGAEARAALEAAYGHMAVLESLLAESPSLGLDEVVSPTLVVRLAAFKHRLEFDESSRGWRCELDADLQVNVRLT